MARNGSSVSRLRSGAGRVCGLVGLCFVAAGCFGRSRATARADYVDDEVTAARVREAFVQAGTEFAGVRVSVRGGDVTLSGTVSTTAARSRAADIALGLPRVDAVENQIEIAPAVPRERSGTDSS